MNRNEKAALLGNSIGSILLVAAGVVLVCHPDFGSAAIAAVIGWTLVIAGGLGILVSIMSWPVFGVLEIALCALGLGLGIYILRNPLALASVLGLALGAWLVIQGASAIWEGVTLKRQGSSAIPNLVLGLAMLGLGLILIFSPLTTSRIIMTLSGLAMIVCGVLNLIIRARSAKYLQENRRKQKIIDADP